MTPVPMTIDEIKAAIEANLPGSSVSIVPNGSPSAQHSLHINSEQAVDTARFLRDHSELRLDFCSNMTAIDWLDSELTEKVKVKKLVDDVETETEETRKTKVPGYLEAVYHLFSMQKKHGPVILRLRTKNRTDQVHLPSLTPIWRSAEFQEREAFDLYGIIFDGHPDLRRIFMWEEFTDHPMRKDYVPPADDEVELMEGARR
jgi:NADH-quinone oxidoreductase subunit C